MKPATPTPLPEPLLHLSQSGLSFAGRPTNQSWNWSACSRARLPAGGPPEPARSALPRPGPPEPRPLSAQAPPRRGQQRLPGTPWPAAGR